MKNHFRILWVLTISFVYSCDRSEIDKLIYNESINNIDDINEANDNSSTNQEIIYSPKKEELQEDIPELLLKTSVSITNLRGERELNIGSGAFISPTIVVTNYHVIEGGNRIEIIRNSDNKIFNGIVKKIDKSHDVCLIELLNDTVEKYLTVNDNYPKIGSDIIVAGSPIGLKGTITKGNISNIRKEEPYDYELIQISAPISPGNSGGPVVNIKGEIIGISVASLIGQGVQNINFAVPSKYIKFLLHN